MKIRGFGKVRKVAKIADLWEISELEGRAPAQARIVTRPGVPGRTEDVLEKRALQGVVGSLPERIVWKWLEQAGHVYEAQRTELGGRMVAGGAVVDFFVYDLAGTVVVLRVQGDYWHGVQNPKRQARDDEQAGRLRAQGYAVVDLWESDIYEAARLDRVGRYVLAEVADAL